MDYGIVLSATASEEICKPVKDGSDISSTLVIITFQR